MKNTLQFHSRQFELIEKVIRRPIFEALSMADALEIRAARKSVSAEEFCHSGATAVLQSGTHNTCFRGEFDGECGLLLD